MNRQRELLSFLLPSPLEDLFAASGLVLNGLSYAQQVYAIWKGGVEPWQLYTGGGVLLFIWVGMMIQHDRERAQLASQPAPVTAPAAALVRNVTSHNQSGGFTLTRSMLARAAAASTIPQRLTFETVR